jgi:cold shock CspA family protein
MEGIITKITDKGWGLITAVGQDNTRLTYFFHIHNVDKGVPTFGAKALFEHSQNRKGLTALNVEIVAGGAQ